MDALAKRDCLTNVDICRIFCGLYILRSQEGPLIKKFLKILFYAVKYERKKLLKHILIIPSALKMILGRDYVFNNSKYVGGPCCDIKYYHVVKEAKAQRCVLIIKIVYSLKIGSTDKFIREKMPSCIMYQFTERTFQQRLSEIIATLHERFTKYTTAENKYHLFWITLHYPKKISNLKNYFVWCLCKGFSKTQRISEAFFVSFPLRQFRCQTDFFSKYNAKCENVTVSLECISFHTYTYKI